MTRVGYKYLVTVLSFEYLGLVKFYSDGFTRVHNQVFSGFSFSHFSKNVHLHCGHSREQKINRCQFNLYERLLSWSVGSFVVLSNQAINVSEMSG